MLIIMKFICFYSNLAKHAIATIFVYKLNCGTQIYKYYFFIFNIIVSESKELWSMCTLNIGINRSNFLLKTFN